MKTYVHEVDIEVVRTQDHLGLSQHAIDQFRLELFTNAMLSALRQAMDSGILPQEMRLKGHLEISGAQ